MIPSLITFAQYRVKLFAFLGPWVDALEIADSFEVVSDRALPYPPTLLTVLRAIGDHLHRIAYAALHQLEILLANWLNGDDTYELEDLANDLQFTWEETELLLVRAMAFLAQINISEHYYDLRDEAEEKDTERWYAKSNWNAFYLETDWVKLWTSNTCRADVSLEKMELDCQEKHIAHKLPIEAPKTFSQVIEWLEKDQELAAGFPSSAHDAQDAKTPRYAGIPHPAWSPPARAHPNADYAMRISTWRRIRRRQLKELRQHEDEVEYGNDHDYEHEDNDELVEDDENEGEIMDEESTDHSNNTPVGEKRNTQDRSENETRPAKRQKVGPTVPCAGHPESYTEGNDVPEATGSDQGYDSAVVTDSVN